MCADEENQNSCWKRHARNGFEKSLWRIKNQEANDTETFICVQMEKMKTHAGRGFEKRLWRIKK